MYYVQLGKYIKMCFMIYIICEFSIGLQHFRLSFTFETGPVYSGCALYVIFWTYYRKWVFTIDGVSSESSKAFELNSSCRSYFKICKTLLALSKLMALIVSNKTASSKAVAMHRLLDVSYFWEYTKTLLVEHWLAISFKSLYIIWQSHRIDDVATVEYWHEWPKNNKRTKEWFHASTTSHSCCFMLLNIQKLSWVLFESLTVWT